MKEIVDLGRLDFIALQPLALVDHVSMVNEALLSSLLQNSGVCARGTDASEVGGSKRVSLAEIQRLLGSKVMKSVPLFHTPLYNQVKPWKLLVQRRWVKLARARAGARQTQQRALLASG